MQIFYKIIHSFFLKKLNFNIIATNSVVLNIENKNIEFITAQIIAFVFLTFISILIYYFIYRDIKLKQLAKKRNFFLELETNLYQYLIVLKDQMDNSILQENKKIKNLIKQNTLDKVDLLIKDFNETIDYNQLQLKIKEIEDSSRKISHVISETNYNVVDLFYILNDIKKRYSKFINIEFFIDGQIQANKIDYKILFRIMFFTQNYIDTVKYKESVICFISVYNTLDHIVYKIWINKNIQLDDNQIDFLLDRYIKYEIENMRAETNLLIFINS